MPRHRKRVGFLLFFILTLIGAVAEQSYAQVYLPGVKFGINDDYFHGFYGYEDTAAMQAAADGYFGILRMPIYWFQLQPVSPAAAGSLAASMDAGAWAALEAKLQAARDRGITIYAFLIMPPQWATHVPAETSTCGTGPTAHLCNNGDVPMYCLTYPAATECQANNPPAESDVRTFVSYAVNRLKGKIKYWGFTNEPSSKPFWTGDGPDSPARTTPTLVTNMLRPGYEEAKKADPSVTVVGPDEIATANWCYLLQNANPYFDIISFHAYQDWNHETMEQRLDDMKPCIDAYGHGKRVWLTEYGDASSLVNDTAASNRVASMNESIRARSWINRALLYRLRGTDNPDFGVMVTEPPGAGPVPKLQYYYQRNYAAAYYSPRVAIDTSLQSSYIADATGGPNYDDYIVISNDHPTSAATVRLTFIFPDGSGRTRDFGMAAHSRTTIRLPDEIGIGNWGPVSVAVQSLTAGVPVYAEHSTYWGTTPLGQGYAGGRSSEGVTASPTWYFAEGNVANGGPIPFYEYLTVFNPNPQAVDVTFNFLLLSGTPVTRTIRINEGPGRAQIKVNDLISLGVTTHSTTISATYVSNGAPAPIAAERSMYWGTDLRDGHGTPGVPQPMTTWYFAEGSQGGPYTTYVAVSNPTASWADVWVTFYNEGGGQTASEQWIAPYTRASYQAPGGFGGYGFTVSGVNGVPVVAERVMYWDADGETWAGGSAGVGSPSLATHWIATEGSMNSFFHTYVLIGNPNGSYANATVTFLRPDGTSLPVAITIPPHTRYTVDTYLYMVGDFATDVTSNVPVVVERSMYWAGTDFYGGHNTMARIIP